MTFLSWVGVLGICFSLSCKQAAPACTAEGCDEGFICSTTGVCLPVGSCGADGDCGSNDYCDGDSCVPRPPCSSNDDCSQADTICSKAGYCIPSSECREFEDCPTGKQCRFNTCVNAGPCMSAADCPAQGFLCNTTTGMCEFNNECGNSGEIATAPDANLLLLLDRSCSMQGKIEMKTKWQLAVDALTTFVNQMGDAARLGLVFFPDPLKADSCDTIEPFTSGNTQFPLYVKAGTRSAITTTLKAGLDPKDILFADGPCVTPIVAGVEAAAMDPSFVGMGSGRNMLLITDGQDTCGAKAGEIEGQLADLLMNHGVKTFVMGFGDQVDQAALTAFAVAGGTALSPAQAPPLDKCSYTAKGMGKQPCLFYLAEDGTALLSQLFKIGDSIRSCDYTFTAVTEPVKTDIGVYVGTTRVAYDPNHANGWDMTWKDDDGAPGGSGSATVTFYGDQNGGACANLKTGTLGRNVFIFLGCPVN